MAVFEVAPSRKDFPSDRSSKTFSPTSRSSGMSWDKNVKGACKSKHAAPKAKYIDPLVQGTFDGEYTCGDIAQAIAPKLRDSNSTVVFKALIVVHTLLRTGNQKFVYSTWSGKPNLLSLNSVSSGHDTAQNLNRYAYYLHTRLKTYQSLGRDAIRDRSERRGEGRGDGGEKLRNLTVEKGLLREVNTLQRLLDTLVECRFYLEDKEDEVTMSALRLLVKDLLVLFMSVNEGVINVLEHYFEMSHEDATAALKVYKQFCRQCEKVVTYLGVAKKMQNILNVQIPNLKHAPVSLVGSLEEYLKDPNFDKNRREYKRNHDIAEGRTPVKEEMEDLDKADSHVYTKPAKTTEPESGSSAATAKDGGNKALIDFFEAIESEQTSMFNPQTGSPDPAYFQQQAAYNPFLRQEVAVGYLQPQMTGALAFGGLQPQMTGAMAFGGMHAFEQPTLTAFGQPQPMMYQATGFPASPTSAANPFRQSMAGAMSPVTPMNPFGLQRPATTSAFSGSIPASQAAATFQAQSSVPQLQPQWTGMPNASQRPSSAPGANVMAGNVHQNSLSVSTGPFGQPPSQPFSAVQPMSAPFSAVSPPRPASAHPLAPQPTGSRNPFAPPLSANPEVPKAPPPSMNQIAFSAFQSAIQPQQQMQQSGQSVMTGSQNSQFGNNAPFGGASSSQQQQGVSISTQPATRQSSAFAENGLMSNLASDFAFGRAGAPHADPYNVSNPQAASSGMPPSSDRGQTFQNLPSGTSSQSVTSSNPSFGFSNYSTGTSNTGSSAFSAGPSTNTAPIIQQSQPPTLQPQPTGFGGSNVKPFVPSSSFGANLFAEHSKGTGGQSHPQQPQNHVQNGQHVQPGLNSNGTAGVDLLGGFNTVMSLNGPGGGRHDAQLAQLQQGNVPNPFRASNMPAGIYAGAAQPQNNDASGAFGSHMNNPQIMLGTNQPSPQQHQQPPMQWGSLI